VFSQAGPNYFKDIDSDIAHETKIHLQSKTVARNKITRNAAGFPIIILNIITVIPSWKTTTGAIYIVKVTVVIAPRNQQQLCQVMYSPTALHIFLFSFGQITNHYCCWFLISHLTTLADKGRALTESGQIKLMLLYVYTSSQVTIMYDKSF